MTNKEGLLLVQGLIEKMVRCKHQLDQLLQENKDMALDPTIASALADLDAATNEVAARLQNLIDAANAAGAVSAAEVVAALQPEIARLKQMGSVTPPQA